MGQTSADTLRMFVEAAALGSFSAAARRLGRSQSTVSEAISGLEVELGVALFDRGSRQPALTEAGRQLEVHARMVLEAQERLASVAKRISEGYEQRLSLVVSDTFQSERFDAMLANLDEQHRDFELEFLIAEGPDVISLVRSGRAQIGLLETQEEYPPDLRAVTTVAAEELGVYVALGHPLSQAEKVTAASLGLHRELRLNSLFQNRGTPSSHPIWSAPSYLMLMDMAQQGFGWAPLPKTLVRRFAHRSLVELVVPGWPRNIAIDAVWSRDRTLGAIGQWLIENIS